LINKDWVLTASHCVDTGHKPTVVLGAHEIGDMGSQNIAVSEIILHPDYDRWSYANDIALLKLSEEAVCGPLVNSICLHEEQQPLPDQVWVTGWGTLEYGGFSPDALMEVSVPLVSNEQCQAAYTWRKIEDGMMCAGAPNGGLDSCQGDSGGPLVYRDQSSNTWFQPGVVSFGKGCGEVGFPGVYARVSEYVDWIESHTTPGPAPTANPPAVTTPEAVDPCANHGCSDICTLDQQTGRPLCSCPDNGSELYPDFRTCGFGIPDVYTRNYAFIVDKEEPRQVVRVWGKSRPELTFDTRSTFGVNYKLFYFENLYSNIYHIKTKKDDLCLTVDHSSTTIIGQKVVAKPCLKISTKFSDSDPDPSQRFWFTKDYSKSYGGVGYYHIINLYAEREFGYITRTSDDELEIRNRGQGQQWFSIDCNGECGFKS